MVLFGEAGFAGKVLCWKRKKRRDGGTNGFSHEEQV